MMIDELDRSNEVIAKHLKEYAQAEDVLSLEDKIKLITELAKYHKDLAQIRKYQAQQIWESIQDFVPMDSKLESERFKRPGTLLEKERAKRLKIVEGSEQQSEGNKDVKEKDSDDHDKIINLQQWVVLVRQESSVDITPSVVKAPIYDWKIFKDKLREVYQIFRVGQAPKAYPYFEAMLKEFDRDDMVTLWKLVKDRFKEELPKSDLEKCLFWPLKVMFEPVATDGLWQFEAPIKSWRLYKSCRVHCLIMEGMIIYMLDDVEYPLPKTTLQKMLDHKCELVSTASTRSTLADNGRFPLLEDFPLLIEDKDYSESKTRIVMFRISGPRLHSMTPAISSSGLGSNHVSQQPCIPPIRDDWDRLFQPMFNEYFNPPTITVSPVQEAAAPRAEVLADSPVSTTIDQDAPSTKLPKTPTFHDDPLNESPHEDSTSQRSSSNVRKIYTSFEHLGRWTKLHPIANVIGDPSRS
ncbi:hypothetical protein Tco_0844029, partial [Tanacetum coccineum]